MTTISDSNLLTLMSELKPEGFDTYYRSPSINANEEIASFIKDMGFDYQQSTKFIDFLKAQFKRVRNEQRQADTDDHYNETMSIRDQWLTCQSTIDRTLGLIQRSLNANPEDGAKKLLLDLKESLEAE